MLIERDRNTLKADNEVERSDIESYEVDVDDEAESEKFSDRVRETTSIFEEK